MTSRLLALGLLSACTTSSEAFDKYVIEHYGSKEHGWQRTSGLVQENPVPADQRSREHGRELYARYCSVCHGAQGQGDGPAAAGMNPKPANLQKIAGVRSDDHIYLQISLGRQGMPVWSHELSERDAWDIVNFVQSLAP